MKLAELIEAARGGMVGCVNCEQQFDAEHGAMNRTSTFGPGLVDLDTFRTLRDPRPHAEVAGTLHTSTDETRSLAPIAEHMGAKP